MSSYRYQRDNDSRRNDNIVYELLKDKLNIVKITFTSGVNAASQDFAPRVELDLCPLCGIELNENGVCPKCGYKK